MSTDTVARFERGEELEERKIDALQRGLEQPVAAHRSWSAWRPPHQSLRSAPAEPGGAQSRRVAAEAYPPQNRQGEREETTKARRSPGRPRIKREVEQLIVRMAKENRDWGYDRIAGALANLGYEVCDQTVGNVLQRHASAARTGAQAHDHLVGLHSDPPGAAGGDATSSPRRC